MAHIQRISREKRVGDTAVDGLISGILAGLGMMVYLLAAVLWGGESPLTMLARFDPARNNQSVTGLLAHLAVSAIYGLIFALVLLVLVRLRPSLVRFGWLLGLVYGLLLFAVARGMALTAVASPILQITAVNLLIAHAIYGLILGFEVSRKW